MTKQEVATIPEFKKKIVKELEGKLKTSKTVLVASIKGLPASQFQKIKKSLRGTAEVVVAKKSLVFRAIQNTDKGALQNLKENIVSDVVLMFSELDAFELSGLLAEKQSATKAKAGDVPQEDIEIQPGPTDLIPGPAISELGSVGLKVAVEGGKLAIKTGAVVAKKGEPINPKVAGVLGKLNILPMKVGFIPLAAYDSKAEKVYVGIKIDKEGTYKELKEAIAKALNFAVNMKVINDKTIGYFIAKAGLEATALENKLGSNNNDKEAGA